MTAEERARLAEVLLESLREAPSADIEAASAHEVGERIAAYDRGESHTYPAEDVFGEARRLTR